MRVDSVHHMIIHDITKLKTKGNSIINGEKESINESQNPWITIK